MDGTITPYDVFRIDTPDPLSNDPEFGAYQLPSGEVTVLTNNFGQSQIIFGSREQADVFLTGVKSKARGEVVELNAEDYPKVLTSAISFEEAKVEAVHKPQQRVERGKPADSRTQEGNDVPRGQVRQGDRANTSESNNNRTEELISNATHDTPSLNNSVRADSATGEQPVNPVLQGAAAGGLEFLAESVEAVPALMFMSGLGATALLLEPLYSAAAEALHELAAEQLYEASQKDETAAQRASAVGYFGATVLSAVAGPKGGTLPSLGLARGGTKLAGLKNIASEASNKLRAALAKPPRGYIVLPLPAGKASKTAASGSSNIKKLEKKLGFKSEVVIYNDKDFFIASDKFLKNNKKGKGTGMDSNHLLLAEWFRKGPAHLQGLQDYVPSYLLANGMEHQGTFHAAFNAFMNKKGLFQKTKYTQAEIEKGLIRAEMFYRDYVGGDLGKAWANACRDFRLNIFSQVKK